MKNIGTTSSRMYIKTEKNIYVLYIGYTKNTEQGYVLTPVAHVAASQEPLIIYFLKQFFK